MIANPFVPPGYEYLPDAPLEAAEHAGWWVASVGGHGDCFARFGAELDVMGRRENERNPSPPRGAITDPALRALRWSGRLVVVEGPEGSGKTTIVNRCVEELRHRAAACEVTLTVEDRRAHDTVRDGRVVSARQIREEVCRDLVEVADEEWLGDDARTRALRQLSDEPGPPRPGLAYEILRRRLGPRRILVVLLPPTPLGGQAPDVEDIESYLGWMGPGTIFFAERTTTPASPAPKPRRPPTGAGPPVFLRLRNLLPGEAPGFVRHRLDTAPGRGPLPDVPDEVLRGMERAVRIEGRSIGWLIRLFETTYRYRLGNSSLQNDIDTLEFVTLQEILERLVPRPEGETT